MCGQGGFRHALSSRSDAAAIKTVSFGGSSSGEGTIRSRTMVLSIENKGLFGLSFM
jgi:hypothetical protein